MGEVPSARELASLSTGSSWGVVKNAFRPGVQANGEQGTLSQWRVLL